MISAVSLQNFGPIRNLKWSKMGRVNICVGKNGCGKTFLLKALYSSLKAVEQYKRGKEFRTLNDILSDKLYWTYQVNSLSSLVSKGEKELHFEMSEHNDSFSFSFGDSTTKVIQKCTSSLHPRDTNSIFIPAKEVLSLQSIILQARANKLFGFDATYGDLAEALTMQVRQGRNYPEFAEIRKNLKDEINGRIEYDETKKEWAFRGNDKRLYPISLTAEGIKKVSILDVLFGNHYLTKDSVVFIDEPESSLHPGLVSSFMEMIFELAKCGVQFFISSHSYAVIKKSYILAHQKGLSVPIVSLDDVFSYGDLRDGMLDNKIVDESINLYKEELAL